MNSKLNITVAQLNPTVGDFEGNLGLIFKAMQKGLKDGAHLVVTPELSLCGYYPGDYLLESTFIEAQLEARTRLIEMSKTTPNLAVVFGFAAVNEGPGKGLHNAIEVVQNGKVLLRYAKQLLPTYNVFDERRHFEPSTQPGVLALQTDSGAFKLGFVICEDAWDADEKSYLHSPLGQLKQQNVDLVISVNASPSNIGKRKARHEVFVDNAQRYDLPIVYVNQVGGQDSLVFDGASFCVEPKNGVVIEWLRFQESINTISYCKRNDWFQSVPEVDGHDATEGMAPNMQEMSPSEFYFWQISLGLKDYMRRCGFTKVLVGSSGGIDSALTIALAAMTIGPENVEAITMPSAYSSEGSVNDSQKLCDNLGVKLSSLPILDGVQWVKDAASKNLGYEPQGLALENLQARIRGTLLMTHSNTTGALLLTTGNKSEVSVGYCTLYGDTSGGLNLIGDLYKTEVFELARHINRDFGKELIPQAIIDKEPSAELAPGQKDSDSLPPYPVLDMMLKKLIEGVHLPQVEAGEIEQWEKQQLSQNPTEYQSQLQRVKSLIARSEYKRKQAAPIIRLRYRAFGAGRQVPITANTQQWI